MARIRRRKFLFAASWLLTGAAVVPRIALAQARKVRIGYLAPRQGSIALQPVLRRLGELGFVEGKNLTLEYRSADGVEERFPSLARELAELKCDLIFAIGPEQAPRALLSAKATVPIVMIAVLYDPVSAGIVANLRRPGGNITGLTLLTPALAVKQLEILHETLPRARRIMVFSDPFNKGLLEAAKQTADRLRLELVHVAFAGSPYDFDSAFEHGRKAGAEALLLLTSPVLLDRHAAIYGLAIKHQLPVSVGFSSYWTGTGWLVGHGPKLDKTFARAGDIAAAILNGRHPGDIPLEQPTEFELAINMITAKLLGIKVPQSILVRADRVIE